MEKVLTAPPELLTLTVEIALLALTDCVAFESEIEGAATAGAGVEKEVNGPYVYLFVAVSRTTNRTL
jgi:hypothetical protein